MAKSPKTRGTRRKKRARRRRADPGAARLLVAVAILLVLAIVGFIAFDDRHWHAFDDAGDGAFARRNYEYAESMYRKALLEAERLEDRQLIAATLSDLERIARASGRSADAASYAARRAALGR